MNSWISKIGPIMQMAYVPKDFEVAIKYWTEIMGVGPFFYIAESALENTLYNSTPTPMSFGLALAYWGDMQIELIKLNDDHPSMFKDWLDNGKSGLHHICVLTQDMDEARAICARAGATILQQSDVSGGGQVIYVDTGGGDGTILEVLSIVPETLLGFEFFKQTSKDWDGSEPFRPIG